MDTPGIVNTDMAKIVYQEPAPVTGPDPSAQAAATQAMTPSDISATNLQNLAAQSPIAAANLATVGPAGSLLRTDQPTAGAQVLPIVQKAAPSLFGVSALIYCAYYIFKK